MIGERQTLSIGALSLTLDWQDFDGTQHNSLGYTRWQKVEHQLQVTESFYGAALVDGPNFAARYQFEWALQLGLEDSLMLDAIYQQQQLNGKGQGSIPVRLVDERFPLLVPSPRTRAKKGSTGITAPTGFEYIWPQFDVLLSVGSDFQSWFLPRDTDDLFKMKLTAAELKPIPVAEDIA